MDFGENIREIIRTMNLLNNMMAVSIFDVVFAMVLAFIVGAFIFWIYTRTYSGVMYSTSFGVSIIALTMISTIVILAVTQNVVLSLGMVGALSIVRFRTAVKDPMDIVFLFWSITAGIVLAAGFITLAIFGSLLIGTMLSLFARRHTFSTPYILMIIGDHPKMEEAIRTQLNNAVKKVVMKSKTISPENTELNFEVRLKDDNTDFIDKLNEVEGVGRVMLVSYNGC